MPKTSFFLHQARTCWSLARITTDPWLKQRYEDLAVDFVTQVYGENDRELAAPFPAGKPPKPDSGDTSLLSHPISSVSRFTAGAFGFLTFSQTWGAPREKQLAR